MCYLEHLLEKVIGKFEKALSWLKLWGWERGWFILILLLPPIIAIWKLPDTAIPSVDGNQQTLYLLSAIAQSLAAVLALVFTISLVVAQLSSKYSHRLLASFFDKLTIFYILLYHSGFFLNLRLMMFL